mmetsp:Transcript_9917/g.60531  ORF Transcript_9917/g.60531 Transcript_9917/m.60531 type:complete len:151 (+) Transcript_9917:1951-2403(+)
MCAMPTSSAPLCSILSTASAFSCAVSCVSRHLGVPKDVRHPFTANRSFATNVRPWRDPSRRPWMRTRGEKSAQPPSMAARMSVQRMAVVSHAPHNLVQEHTTPAKVGRSQRQNLESEEQEVKKTCARQDASWRQLLQPEDTARHNQATVA